MKKILFIFLLLTAGLCCHSQSVQLLDSTGKASIRGLSVVDDNTIWASGSSGYIGRSIDGGKTFSWTQVKSYEQRDFRDIEAFDSKVAVALAVDAPAVIVKTTDGGDTWKEVFRDTTKGMFLDAMDYDNNGNGIAVGDPINDKLFFAETKDYGNTWKSQPGVHVEKGEALFAASGSNIKIVDMNKYYVTGGTRSRLFLNNDSIELNNIVKGKESTGANSIAININEKRIVIVGGDFSNDTSSTNNCVLLNMQQDKLLASAPTTSPHGYRSCVIFTDKNKLLCCGTSGVDISMDGGINWQLISKESFHVCAKAKKGSAVYLAGSKGRIAKLIY